MPDLVYEPEPVAEPGPTAGAQPPADDLPFEFVERAPAPPSEEPATIAMPSLAPFAESAPAEAEDRPAAAEPEPAPVDEAPAMRGADAPPPGVVGDPVDTKLELAEAYLEMGDPEAARQMLDEVMDEGDSRQKAEALRLRALAGPGQRRA